MSEVESTLLDKQKLKIANKRTEDLQRMHNQAQEHINKLSEIINRTNLELIDKNDTILNLVERIKAELINSDEQINTLNILAKESVQSIEKLNDYIIVHEKRIREQKIREQKMTEEIQRIERNEAIKFRRNLEKLKNETHTFIGRYVREGRKRNVIGTIESTILLRDIKLSGCEDILSDHIWINKHPKFEKINLQENDLIEISAQVVPYEKIARRYEGMCLGTKDSKTIIDYRLAYPTRVKNLSKNLFI